MTKALKRFLLICLSVVTFAFMGAAVACGETQPQKVTYTVEVVDEDNTAVVGANVIFCKDGQCDTPVVTGTDGKVSVEKDAGVYEVHATAPTGSDLVDSETKLTLSKAENQTIKLTLEVEKSEYTVMVYNEYDEAVAGATVDFYAFDMENPPMSEPPVAYTGTTDANGIVTVELPSSYYVAKVNADGCEESMTYLYPTSDTAAVVLAYAQGSENAPYTFYGTDSFEVNGTAYFNYTANAAGKYVFSVMEEDSTINVGTSSAAIYVWEVSQDDVDNMLNTLDFSVTTTASKLTVYLAVVSGEGT